MSYVVPLIGVALALVATQPPAEVAPVPRAASADTAGKEAVAPLRRHALII